MLVAIAFGIGAGFAALAWANPAEDPNAPACDAWPWATLRAPCGASFRGHGRANKFDFEITRAGEWQVEHSSGPRATATYSSYASGASFKVGNGAPGQPAFSIDHDFKHPTSKLTKTDDVISFLGETCRVWVTIDSFSGMEHQDCITDDGVPLLHDYASDRNGSLREKFATGAPILARMTRFERGAVSQAEVRPPASLFAWSRWAILPGAANDGQLGYEVRLEDAGGSGRPENEITIRRLGRIELQVERQRDQVRKMLYRSPNRVAEFFTFQDGRPRSLTISLATDGQIADRIRRTEKVGAPAGTSETETILGEKCRWYDLAPGWSDISQHECRTADGIPLARQETQMASYSLIARATFLRRGAVQPADVLPPIELIRAELWLRPRTRSVK